ncbi:hypothetical protein ATH84_10829 [Paracoccus versutus]|uniref:Uncharacterized protein n=1 Tax=Paracoccus versutus TaxID=34007 RepID=A0AAQ0KIM0_PARVE|nr:hypothetical protein ATH84_10829 [Paracoccus versutus]
MPAFARARQGDAPGCGRCLPVSSRASHAPAGPGRPAPPVSALRVTPADASRRRARPQVSSDPPAGSWAEGSSEIPAGAGIRLIQEPPRGIDAGQARAHPPADAFSFSLCPPSTRQPAGQWASAARGARRRPAGPCPRRCAPAGRTTPASRPLTVRQSAAGRAAPSPLRSGKSTGLFPDQIGEATPIADRGTKTPPPSQKEARSWLYSQLLPPMNGMKL